ncbi:hypothetical protein N0V94_008045 [Neodidymelliopsis sp. IMI 364377]|nr:hypothetical protein N0V94_008045 [Neodidymelliopsis sp. IMI 364377]
MADPLSVIAGIVGIAAASAHLANTVHDFGDRFNNARSQMHEVGSETAHLSSILANLAVILEQGHGKYKVQVLTDTKSIIERIERVQDDIRKMIRRNSGFRARVGWALSPGKIAELLNRIEALKSSLSIVLATVQLAVAHSEPKSPQVEIERLQQLVVAGVKEIRQSIIGLQQAKPAVMFEPLKLLAADEKPSALLNVLEHQGLALPEVLSSTRSEMQLQQSVAQKATEAMEPSDSQFETAHWLYCLTLADHGNSMEDLPQDDVNQDDTTNTNELDWSNELHAMRSGLRQSNSPARIPSPQRLYDISISSTAWRLTHTWTFLQQADVSFEDYATKAQGLVDSAEVGQSDHDTDFDSSRRERPRRRFALPDYNHALETGTLLESTTQLPQSSKKLSSNSLENAADGDPPSKPTTQSRLPPSKQAYTEDFHSEKIFDYAANPPSSAKKAPPTPTPLPAHHDSGAKPHGADDDRFRPRDKRRSKPRGQQPSKQQSYTESQSSMDEQDPLPPHFPYTNPFTYPYPSYPYPPPPPPPPPPGATKEEAAIEKLNELLLRKLDEDSKLRAETERAAEMAKFDRLESLLIAQQEAQIAREKAELKAAQDAAVQESKLGKKSVEDKLAKLEMLILTQKEEQLNREAATEAERKASTEAANTKELMIKEERKAAAEASILLLDAATKAREEAEKEATRQAYEMECAHEKAIAEAKAAIEEAERSLQEERKLRKEAEKRAKKLAAPPPPPPPPPPEEPFVPPPSSFDTSSYSSFGDEEIEQARSSLIDVLYGKENKKWYMTASGPSLLDISDGYFARKAISNTHNEDEDDLTSGDRNVSDVDGRTGSIKDCANAKRAGSAALMELLTAPKRYHLIFPTGYQKYTCESSSLTSALELEGTNTMFEIDPASGQTWFYGPRPIHVRFNRPDYNPRFADFQIDTTHDCIMIGTDVVDEDAFRSTGIDYDTTQLGFWKLEPALTYEDIAALVATSFTLREAGLRRMARKAMNTSKPTIG